MEVLTPPSLGKLAKEAEADSDSDRSTTISFGVSGYATTLKFYDMLLELTYSRIPGL
jgi:hypothetical protein